LASARLLHYDDAAMNEFDLQGLEREIQAWRRRLDSHDAPLVRAALDDIARDVVELRVHALTPNEHEARRAVEQRLCRLLALYDATNTTRGSA
jgi:hypothetical protein